MVPADREDAEARTEERATGRARRGGGPAPRPGPGWRRAGGAPAPAPPAQPSSAPNPASMGTSTAGPDGSSRASSRSRRAATASSRSIVARSASLTASWFAYSHSMRDGAALARPARSRARRAGPGRSSATVDQMIRGLAVTASARSRSAEPASTIAAASSSSGAVAAGSMAARPSRSVTSRASACGRRSRSSAAWRGGMTWMGRQPCSMLSTTRSGSSVPSGLHHTRMRAASSSRPTASGPRTGTVGSPQPMPAR